MLALPNVKRWKIYVVKIYLMILKMWLVFYKPTLHFPFGRRANWCCLFLVNTPNGKTSECSMFLNCIQKCELAFP